VGPLSGAWNSIFANLYKTSEKLIELGFTYYNGKVAIIERSEELDPYGKKLSCRNF